MMKCKRKCTAKSSISVDKWIKIKTKCQLWEGLDRFTDIFQTVPWENGPSGYYICSTCFISLCSADHLSRAQVRKQKNAADSENEIQEDIQPTVQPPPSPKRLRSSLGTLYHPKTACVWCMKGEDKKHRDRKAGQLRRIETSQGWRAFKRHTVFIEDKELRVRIERVAESTSQLLDPFAADIMYHKDCWMKYVSHPLQRPPMSGHYENVTHFEMKNLFLRYVDQIIFGDHEIRTLQSLLFEFKRLSFEYGFTCGEVRGSYIKDMLIREYGDIIGFRERAEKNKSELVYDVGGGGDYINMAVTSLGISDEQLVQNVSSRLGTNIIDDTFGSPWPPHVDELEDDEQFSELLVQLLQRLHLKGHPRSAHIEESDPKLRTLVSLITYFATGKKTNVAVNIAVDVHGSTRSREMIDMLHGNGLCISYEDLLLLYDHWALTDVETSATCPAGIRQGEPAIGVADNDDFPIDTLTGNATGAHRTNVMFVQPVEMERRRPDETRERHTNKKETTQKLNNVCEGLNAVQQYIVPTGAGREPLAREVVNVDENGTRPQRIRSVVHSLARVCENGSRPSPEDQRVPSYSGLQSCIQDKVNKSKPYYHTTYNEPPKKSVVNDIMCKLKNSMVEKSMPYSFLVGDLPTYKLILELKVENSEKYKDIIPTLGAFHQQMSYIYAIYKRFKGSGLSEVLVSAGVIVEGSVDQALKGKHYRRGLRCILLWREALIHKRLTKQLESSTLSPQAQQNLRTLRNALTETTETLASAYGKLEDDETIRRLVDEVYEKPGTDMGDYWLSFLEMSDVLIQNVHACHVCDLDEYLSSSHDMLPGLLAYNNHDYGKWLPDYWAMISNLPDERKKYFSTHFAQSMTGLPYSCQPMDLWIETTMNLNSKLKQGWLQLLQNDKQLFCTTRNANNVARVKQNMKNYLNSHRRSQKHVDCQPARLIKDEQAVQDLVTCMDEFEADPFDDSMPFLRSLQSGIPASSEILEDLKIALDEGREQANDILKNRVFSKNLNLKDTLSRNNRLNLASTPVQVASKISNVDQMEKNGLATLMDFAEKNSLIDLETFLEGRITEECLSLYNVDGSMRKTAKSKVLQGFVRKQHDGGLQSCISFVDMGLIWRLATPTTEDRDIKKRCGAEYKWVDYLNKVVSMVFSRHQTARTLILINDVYSGSNIKDDEHDRRAAKQINLPNVFPKEIDNFPSVSQFKKIMLKSENKTRLQKLLKQRFKARITEARGQVIYCEGVSAENLTTGTQDQQFVFQQAEADTMLLTAYSIVRDNGDNDDVVIDSEDSDVCVQASYVSKKLPGTLLIKNKNGLFKCKDMVSSEIAEVIIALYELTGSDHNSGFFGHGKKKILEKVKKDPEAQKLLMEVGDNLVLKDAVKEKMKKFVLSIIYSANSDSCSKARASKWRKMKKKSMARLPPDDDTLNHHCERTNYLTYCLKHFELQTHPSPLGHGYESINGRCRPVRYRRSALPENVAMTTSNTSVESDESGSEYGESSEDSEKD